MSNIMKKSNDISIYKKQFLPIEAVRTIINGDGHIITVISDKNFHRHVMLLNEKGNLIKTILDTEEDSVKLARDKTHLYIACSTHYHSKLYKFSLNNLSIEEVREYPFTDIGSISVNDNQIYFFDAKDGYIYELNKDLETNDKTDMNEYKKNSYGHSFNYIVATNNGFTSIGLPSSEEEFYKLKAFLYHEFGRTTSDSNDFIKSIAYDKKNNVGYLSFQNFIIVIDKKGINGILNFKKQSIVSISYDDIDTDSLVICFAGQKPFTGYIVAINKETIDKIKIPIKNKDGKYQLSSNKK